MKKTGLTILTIILAACYSIPTSAQIKGDDILDVWLTEDKDAHSKIENRRGKYFASII